VVNFTKDYVKDSYSNIILMVKKRNDNNLLPKFKKHSQFKRYKILNFLKFKIFFKILNFKNPLAHVNGL